MTGPVGASLLAIREHDKSIASKLAPTEPQHAEDR